MNNALPDRIVVFRDGVGDGQMNTVKEYEVPQLMSCFASFEANYQPKLAMVFVQKRISTRIFSRGGRRDLAPVLGGEHRCWEASTGAGRRAPVLGGEHRCWEASTGAGRRAPVLRGEGAGRRALVLGGEHWC